MIAENPLPGDVIEINESQQTVDGEGFDGDALLRVLAVVEDHVGFKEYGKGRFWIHRKAWLLRLERATVRKMLRSADQDYPF